jgi:hypothetical protein
MLLVLDELLVHSIRKNSLRPKPPGQQLYKVVLKLAREISDMFPRVLSHNKHLPKVSFGLGVALEPILISALFLADLAEPSKALQAFRLHLVRQIFGRSHFCSRHLGLSKYRT